MLCQPTALMPKTAGAAGLGGIMRSFWWLVGAALLLVTTALKIHGELRGERAENRAVDIL